MQWRDVVSDMLKPEDKLASVIDTYMALGQVLEVRKAIKDGRHFGVEEYDQIVLNCLFVINFFPFYNMHGGVIRPLFIQAIQSDSDNFIEDFFSEAIPCALTIAMPHRQKDYADLRKIVKEKFKR